MIERGTKGRSSEAIVNEHGICESTKEKSTTERVEIISTCVSMYMWWRTRRKAVGKKRAKEETKEAKEVEEEEERQRRRRKESFRDPHEAAGSSWFPRSQNRHRVHGTGPVHR